MLQPAPPFPSLSSIRAFEAAARLGNFAAAARELGTSAASVSYHIRQLERQVGATLFRRLPQRVELTQAGALIAKETVLAFDALRNAFAAAAALDAGKLTLTTLPTIGVSWLTPRLGRFRAQHPGVRVELDVSPDAKELASGAFDAAIRNGHGRWAGLRAMKLFPSIFMPLCAPHLHKTAARIRCGAWPADLALLGRPDWWALWGRALGERKPLTPERFGMRFTEEHLDAAAAIAGHGVTIGSPILFAEEIAAGRLAPAHDLVASDGRAFWFVYPIARRPSQKIAHFQQWLKREAAEASQIAKAFIDNAVTVKEN